LTAPCQDENQPNLPPSPFLNTSESKWFHSPGIDSLAQYQLHEERKTPEETVESSIGLNQVTMAASQYTLEELCHLE
jgi:hypothetical protein